MGPGGVGDGRMSMRGFGVLVGRLLGAGLLLALAGCVGAQTDTIEARLQLVVADNYIREEGVECAGARPYRHVHAGARYVIESEEGTVLAQGRLPAGRAMSSDPSIDWEVARIPTFCVMELCVAGLPRRDAYVLRLERGLPLKFDASLISDEAPVRLTVQ